MTKSTAARGASRLPAPPGTACRQTSSRRPAPSPPAIVRAGASPRPGGRRDGLSRVESESAAAATTYLGMDGTGAPIRAKAMSAMFASLASAILDHQNTMMVRHGGKTSWRIQSLRACGSSQRAWQWNSINADAVFFHMDPSRSAWVAMKLFGSAQVTVFLVCHRYAAYRKLACALRQNS